LNIAGAPIPNDIQESSFLPIFNFQKRNSRRLADRNLLPLL
jgi:hypothetical protein